MKYAIKAHPTIYRGVRFRSRLEAKWAAFFDSVGWCWEYEPIDLDGWSPDFSVSFRCVFSDCCDPQERHLGIVEVKPYFHASEFERHHWFMNWPLIPNGILSILALGINPNVTVIDTAGRGLHSLDYIVDDSESAWKRASNLTQWKPTNLIHG